MDHVALTAPLTCLLEVTALLFALLFLMFLTFQAFITCLQWCVTSLQIKVSESSVNFLFIPRSRQICSCFCFGLNASIKSCPESSTVPPPSLSHELIHPTHDLPLPLPVSPKGEMTVTAQQALQWQLHGDLSVHSLLGSRPLVIFSQPEVSRTCEMVQHLAERRGWWVSDRYFTCRSGWRWPLSCVKMVKYHEKRKYYHCINKAIQQMWAYLKYFKYPLHLLTKLRRHRLCTGSI